MPSRTRLADLVDQIVGRALDLFGYDWPSQKRWGETPATAHASGGPEHVMSSEVTKPDEVALRAKLAELMQEHRDLDTAIAALLETGSRDQLQLTRLKKRKLQLKDEIAKINDRCCPTSLRSQREPRLCAYIASSARAMARSALSPGFSSNAP